MDKLDMLDITSKYVQDHNITFSTDPEPNKIKTKEIVFTKNCLLLDLLVTHTCLGFSVLFD